MDCVKIIVIMLAIALAIMLAVVGAGGGAAGQVIVAILLYVAAGGLGILLAIAPLMIWLALRRIARRLDDMYRLMIADAQNTEALLGNVANMAGGDGSTATP